MGDHGRDPAQGWVTPPRPSAEGARNNWARAGLLAAALWVALGTALAYASAQLGSPDLSGSLALASGPLALGLVGWRYRFARGDWLPAAIVTVGAVVAVGSVVLFGLTILAYG